MEVLQQINLDQLRQNLQDSDKLREMAMKVNLSETSLKQARLVVFTDVYF